MPDVLATSAVLENTVAKPLSATLLNVLEGAVFARLAVGYLFVEGLAPLVDALSNVGRIELLIGNVVNRLTDEQLRESGAAMTVANTVSDEEIAANYREARNRAATETALNLRKTFDALSHTESNRTVLVEIARWIAEGRLKVRLYAQHRLHAKVALIGYAAGHPHAPGRAIVGTSNFTMPAETAASNLDVLLEGQANFDQIMSWFGLHWAEAQDFQRDLFVELGRAWPLAEM